MRSLGVSLKVYKVNEKWEWTSLLGGEKKILLRKLPDVFEKILPAQRVEKTKQLWIVSHNLHHYIVLNNYQKRTKGKNLQHNHVLTEKLTRKTQIGQDQPSLICIFLCLRILYLHLEQGEIQINLSSLKSF